MALVENVTRRKLKSNEIALGFGVHHLRTVATGAIAAAAGHDWLFIDMEHGAFSVQEATQICIAALPTGVTPIVRCCADALDVGTRALDNGALGVVVPHVDTVEQAKAIAKAAANTNSTVQLRAAGSGRERSRGRSTEWDTRRSGARDMRLILERRRRVPESGGTPPRADSGRRVSPDDGARLGLPVR